jgi:hypothetical protein
LRAELEEVAGRGELVMVGVRTPGVDARRVRQADDRNYGVFMVRDGRVVALRDCRDRQEAVDLTGIGLGGGIGRWEPPRPAGGQARWARSSHR